MTPELIAELRDWFPFDGSLGGYSCSYMPTPRGPYDTLPDRWHEMLDEIERLRQLVRNPHTLEGVNVPFCGAGGCAWTASPNMAGASHAAHIEELLNGGAK